MKLRKILVLFLMVIISTFVFGDNHSNQVNSKMVEGLTYTNYIETELGMDIYWEFSENQELFMMLKAPVSGWISIGFEPSKKMKGAKIIIVGFKDEEVILEEYYGNTQISHRKIKEKYITEFYGERTEEYSLAEFVIPLDNESRYNSLQPGSIIKTIIAYHNSSDSFSRRHSKRDTIDINF